MSARSDGAALEGAQEERRGDGRLQALGLVVSPGTHDVSEWNHLKFIVHLFPVLMQRCLFTVYWTVLINKQMSYILHLY